jgi:hypothetical protein
MICTLDSLSMLFLSPNLWTIWMASPTLTLFENAHPHAQSHFLSQFSISTQTILYKGKVTPHLVALWIHHKTKSSMTTWIHCPPHGTVSQSASWTVQTTFSPLHHHSGMLLHLPIYSLECIGFTLNHSSQCKKNPMPKFSLYVSIFMSSQSSKWMIVLNLPPFLKSPQCKSISTRSVANVPSLPKCPNILSKVIQ